MRKYCFIQSCQIGKYLNVSLILLNHWKSIVFNSALTFFQEISLTLMRPRLNLRITDLTYIYNISKSTSSKLFLKQINVSYHRLSHLIKWLDCAELVATMPLLFCKYFGIKVVFIIDCFEIFINKPSNYMARAWTWSQ